jgi:hypothetical protein
MTPPNGFDEIINVFGDIRKYVDTAGVLSSAWNSVRLATAQLPFALPLSWDMNTRVQKITCHEMLVSTFERVFQQIQDEGLQDTVQSYGGCFMYRPQRTGSKLSTHAWGIAIDLNTNTNQQGTDGDMDPRLVKVFTDAGFEWGGSWEGRVKDPMHMQYCTGY